MDSRYLRSLIVVIDRGSIAEAARVEGMTAAAISQRINALEREFGFALLSRIGHSAKPTQACLNILPRARHIIKEFTLLAGDNDATGLSGTLKIGAISTALTGLLPGAMRTMAKDTPSIKLEIVPGASQLLYEAVLSDDLDAAIIVAPPFVLPKLIKASSLRKEALVFLSKNKPNAGMAEMLRDRPYLRYLPETWGGRHAAAYLHDQGIANTPMCDLDALETIAMLVHDDVGVSLVPNWPTLERLAESCYLTPIEDERYYREVIMISKLQTTRPNMIAALTQALMMSSAGDYYA
jgi:DNA-binding transcriptional LysR family regulator